MSFAFLAPLGLVLLGLLVGPVLVHLTRREPTEDRAFGLLFLLDRLLRKVQRRRQIHDRLLLLLRLLALALVLLAAGRPELRWPEGAAPFGGSGRVIVVLDTSMSMDQRVNGGPAFDAARTDAAAVLRSLPSGVGAALITAGAPAELLTPAFVDDPERVAQLVEDQRHHATRTDLHGALVAARELLGENPGEILIYTDESGPGVIGAAEPDLAALLERGTAILPRVFGPSVHRNLVPVDVRYGDGLEGGTLTARVLNFGPDPVEAPATAWLPDGAHITTFVEVPGALGEGLGTPGSVEARFTVPRQAEGGVGRLEVDDSAMPMDNAHYFHLPRVGASRVMVVDGDPGATPSRSETYFVERALAPWGAGGVAVNNVAPTGVIGLDPDKHRVVVLANVADPSGMAGALTDFVRKGGGLVIGMGDNVTAERYDEVLGGLLPAPLRLVRDLAGLDEEGVALAPPDITGLFEPFARSGRAGFGRVRVRRVMTVEPYREGEVETLLRTADGVPMLLGRRIGTGRVVLWLSTLDLAWTNLPLQSIYVPLVQRLVASMGGSLAVGVVRGEAVAGEDARIELPATAGELQVTGPDGSGLSSHREDATLVFRPVVPGAHGIAATDGRPVGEVAVNAPVEESDVRAGGTLSEAQLRLMPDRLFRKEELGGWSLLSAAAVLLLVSLAAGGRHAATS